MLLYRGLHVGLISHNLISYDGTIVLYHAYRYKFPLRNVVVPGAEIEVHETLRQLSCVID